MDAGVGGQLQGISLDSFLQMVQMEKTTCTLKVVSGIREGFLYILEGELISAESQGLEAFDAACAIISWEDTTIEIDNSCSKSENEINQPLMHVLMEGLKMKDEAMDGGSGLTLENAAPPDTTPTEGSGLTLENAAPPDTTPAEEPELIEVEIEMESEGDEEGEEAETREQTETTESDGVGEEEEETLGTPILTEGRDISKTGDDFELHIAPKKEGGRPKLPIILGLLLVAAIASYFAFSSSSGDMKKNYQETMAKVDLAEDPNEQVWLLQEFIQSAEEENEWTEKARLKVVELKTMRENAAYLKVSARADELVAANDYMSAINLYRKHLHHFPDSLNKGEIKAKLSKLETVAEQTDYAAVTAAAKSRKASRINVYRTYIEHHPQGPQAERVKGLITEMEGEYLAYTEKQIAKSAMLEDWVSCTDIVYQYAAIYPDGPNTQKLKKYLPLFERNRLEYVDYKNVMEKAHAAGTDYTKAQKVLSDYLQAFPGTHLADNIQDQISRYKKMDEEAKLNGRIARVESLMKKSEGRFVSNGDGTFTDKRTGLMWCTLDSSSVLDGCLKYESAIAYIKALNTGGHGNWRLPTPGELQTLLKVKPYFPETDASWFWSSKILKKYVGEWLIDVTVVTANNKSSPAMMSKDSRHCGNVRAVRRP